MKDFILVRVESRDIENLADKVFVASFASPLSTQINTAGVAYGAILKRKVSLTPQPHQENVYPTSIDNEKTSTKISINHVNSCSVPVKSIIYVQKYVNGQPVYAHYCRLSDRCQTVSKNSSVSTSVFEGAKGDNVLDTNAVNTIDYNSTILSPESSAAVEITRYTNISLGGAYFNNQQAISQGLYAPVLSAINSLVIK